MVNAIKVKRDGERCLISVDHCIGDMADRVNRFLLSILGMQPDSEPIPAVTPMEPMEEKELPSFEKLEKLEDMPIVPQDGPQQEQEEFVLPEGTYQGMTVQKALQSGQAKAAVEIVKSAKNMNGPQKDRTIKECKAYIYQDMERQDTETVSPYTIKNFFSIYRPLISSGIQEVLNKSGYSTVEDFLDFSDIDMQRDAFSSIVEELRNRVSAH